MKMELAGLGRRVIALFIDWIIAVLSVSAFTGATFPPRQAKSFGDLMTQTVVNATPYVVEVGLLVGLLGFSIGKRIVGIRVENPDGRPPGPLYGLLRALMVCLIIPPIVQNAEGRGLHDVLTNTRQVRM